MPDDNEQRGVRELGLAYPVSAFDGASCSVGLHTFRLEGIADFPITQGSRQNCQQPGPRKLRKPSQLPENPYRDFDLRRSRLNRIYRSGLPALLPYQRPKIRCAERKPPDGPRDYGGAFPSFPFPKKLPPVGPKLGHRLSVPCVCLCP